MKWKPEHVQNHHLSDGQSYAKPFLLRKSQENPGASLISPNTSIMTRFCNLISFCSLQRLDNGADLSDFEVSNRYSVDDTGPVYIQHSIDASSTAFGNTKLKTMTLHWDEEVTYNNSNTFDVIVARDFLRLSRFTSCLHQLAKAPFFEEFHNAIACTVKLLLRNSGPLEAIFFSPKRGDTLDKLLEKVEENGLNFSILENYDSEVWKCHQGFMAGDNSWPSYENHHCYPLFVRIHYKLSRPFIFRSTLAYYSGGSEVSYTAILATKLCERPEAFDKRFLIFI
ncbi:hypothetical protein NC651_013292 [Populus alba x Populus x berolinensis]|nr:hypothetical protein NC651_013292 [Populus alba x Populus x berolinensis]